MIFCTSKLPTLVRRRRTGCDVSSWELTSLTGLAIFDAHGANSIDSSLEVAHSPVVSAGSPSSVRTYKRREDLALFSETAEPLPESLKNAPACSRDPRWPGPEFHQKCWKPTPAKILDPQTTPPKYPEYTRQISRNTNSNRIQRSFLCPEIGWFSPHFGTVSLLSYTSNLESKENKPSGEN